MWSTTVLASGSSVGVVVYTGQDTRSVMNTSKPISKIGLLDVEVNFLTKLLFIFLLGLTISLMILKVTATTQHSVSISFSTISELSKH